MIGLIIPVRSQVNSISNATSLLVTMPSLAGLLQIYFYILPVLNRLAIFMAIWPVCMFQPMPHARAGGKTDQLAEFYEFKNSVSHCAQNCIYLHIQSCISHRPQNYISPA